jgi:hypothetical protein
MAVLALQRAGSKVIAVIGGLCNGSIALIVLSECCPLPVAKSHAPETCMG